jgi:ElaA protein
MQKNWKIIDWKNLEKSDLYQIIQLRNQVFVVEQNCIYQDADDKDQKAFHLFAKQNDKIIAYARMFKSGDYFDNASIGRVVVNPTFRKQHLGKKLMQKAIDFVLNDLKENSIEISAQTYLIKFYKDLGFIPFGKEYLEDNLPHIRMLYKKNADI